MNRTRPRSVRAISGFSRKEPLPAAVRRQRPHRPLGAHREAPLVSANGSGDEVLEHLFHRKQQGAVDVRAGEGGKTTTEQEQPRSTASRCRSGASNGRRCAEPSRRPRSSKGARPRTGCATGGPAVGSRDDARTPCEPQQREVDQTVRGSVRGELVVADVEPRAVDQILADMRREQNPPAQAGEIRLLRAVTPGRGLDGSAGRLS